MYESCLAKQVKIKELFARCQDREACYERILELGKEQAKLSEEVKTEANRVHGCQSLMYLETLFDGERIHFKTEADALISAGLGVLLTKVYSDEIPEAVLKCPPDFLEELGITEALSLNRANGLASLLLRMKQEAIQCLIKKGNN